MNSDDVLRMRCTGCGAIWLTQAEARDVDAGDRCLRCDGALIDAD